MDMCKIIYIHVFKLYCFFQIGVLNSTSLHFSVQEYLFSVRVSRDWLNSWRWMIRECGLWSTEIMPRVTCRVRKGWSYQTYYVRLHKSWIFELSQCCLVSFSASHGYLCLCWWIAWRLCTSHREILVYHGKYSSGMHVVKFLL